MMHPNGFPARLPLGRRAFYLHPVFVFSAVWLGVAFLYSLHLSGILQYSTAEAYITACYLWLPFVIVALVCSTGHHLLDLAHPRRKAASFDLDLLERRLALWFRLWIYISLVEIAVSGGMPIFWLAMNSAKTYVNFGIPSLHGLVNSLLMSIGICRFVLFLITGKRRHLFVPAFVIVWSVLAVTRQLMIVSVIEFIVVFLQMRRVRPATFVRLGVLAMCLILMFGLAGDLRLGSSGAFRLLAQPTANYPDWLPSGALWAYIYITTPINNLMYTMHVAHPVDSFLFPNTASTLFPTVLRIAIYGNHLGEAESGQLVVSTFNVSTAYVGPYEDYGIFGMALLSVLSSLVCQSLWFRRDLRSVLMYAVATQCLVLNLFFNQFFSLPVISQLVWLAYFFAPKMRFGVFANGARTGRLGGRASSIQLGASPLTEQQWGASMERFPRSDDRGERNGREAPRR